MIIFIMYLYVHVAVILPNTNSCTKSSVADPGISEPEVAVELNFFLYTVTYSFCISECNESNKYCKTLHVNFNQSICCVMQSVWLRLW